MKKILVLVSAVLLMAGIAMAMGPQGQTTGKGMGPGSGCAMCDCSMMGGGAQMQMNQVTDADAKKAFEDYVKVNLKGFSVERIEKVEVPRGTKYFATVTDKKNTFQLHMNPWGRIVGPFPVAEVAK